MKGEEIDDLISYYITACTDSKLYEELRHNVPSYRLDFYDILNYVMELQDTLRVLRGEEIDINSITAYILSVVVM